jgi:large subunit ribosomal protein L18
MQRTATSKNDLRLRRHARIRGRLRGTSARPRLAIHRSNRFVSAQLVDDTAGKTLASAHGREFPGAQSAQATAVGEAIAKRAKDLGVTAVVFDRGGYQYGAQVAALADAARAGGLSF